MTHKEPAAASSNLKPTLARHVIPFPYDRLFTTPPDAWLKECKTIARALASESSEKIGCTLADIALDVEIDGYDDAEVPTDPRALARLNAMVLLKEMPLAAATQLDRLIALLVDDNLDVYDFAPDVLGSIGEPAMDRLAGILTDPQGAIEARISAADALMIAGEVYPELMDRSAELLEKVVAEETEEKELVGVAIVNLLDMPGRDVLPLILQAFLEERVDDGVVEMADIEEHFGLPTRTARTFAYIDDGADGSFQAESGTVGVENGDYGTDDEDDNEPQIPFVAEQTVGRNEPCPCGSGKKYKKCHGA